MDKTEKKLEEILLLYCPDIVVITETRLPSNYSLVRLGRHNGWGGSGAIGVEQGIEFGIDNPGVSGMLSRPSWQREPPN